MRWKIRSAAIRAFIRFASSGVAVFSLLSGTAPAQPQGISTGTLRVLVRDTENRPVAGVLIEIGSVSGKTTADGRVTLMVPVGRVDVIATRAGFDPAAAQITVLADMTVEVSIEMQPRSEIEETVIVSATRADRRIEDEPVRVEVVAAEEVQEKIAMAPGDVSMLLAETNGLRVQSTSPSLGGATVRIQGLSGRYTQILADGLPLYGGQSGSVGILQIPPMDLAQVEVIKGVASALYGMSAVGGVVNLISRRPVRGSPDREFLINRTSHRGTDAALWTAQSFSDHWGFSILGGLHVQGRSDLDGDGWSDLPMFRRLQARPRVLWDNGNGRSALVTMGVMDEIRRGGTVAGASLPDGTVHPENLNTRRVDAGFVGRMLIAGARVLTLRASGVTQRYDHTFGPTREHNDQGTWFGEVSLRGTHGRHTAVAGTAAQYDTLRVHEGSRFNYDYTTTGLFGQDDYTVNQRLIVSGSGRADIHNEFGAFFSPKLSALVRLGNGFTTRISGGRGHIAPAPFTDETEASGLTPLAPLGSLRPEDATSVSGDVTWARGSFEITGTLFGSRIDHAVMFRELDSGPFAARLVNARRPTLTRGTEFIGRFHEERLDIILTHMYVSSSEQDLDDAGTREVPLNPRHSASFDVLWKFGQSQVGIEAFYVGRQALEDNPFRTRSDNYALFGCLLTHRVGRALVYVNAENLGDVRQTRYEPLLRPQSLRDGRRAIDSWAPLDGRSLNAGLRFKF